MKFYILSTVAVLLISGCSQQEKVIVPIPEVKKENTQQHTYKAPKKNIKLKEVEDTNFSSEYMYPKAKDNKNSTTEIKKSNIKNETTIASNNIETKECIALIGQDKFDKYSQIYGTSGALKKCKMFKAI